jgi:hypothetical protein
MKHLKGSESPEFEVVETFSLLIASTSAFASLPYPSLSIFSLESSLKPSLVFFQAHSAIIELFMIN